MTLDIDIYRSANTLINKHGGKATHEAYRQYDKMLISEDNQGARLWLRIVEAIEWIQSESKREFESSH